MEVARRLLQCSRHTPCADRSVLNTDSLSGGRHTECACYIIVAAVGLVQAANLSYFDRPEETALLWIWLEVLTAPGPRPGLARAAATGLCVGLAGLTSPWVGMLGLLLVTTRTLLYAAQAGSDRRRATWSRAGLSTAIVAAVACSLAAAWYAVMEALFPGAVREQLSATLHYLKEAQISGGWRDKLEMFSQTDALQSGPIAGRGGDRLFLSRRSRPTAAGGAWPRWAWRCMRRAWPAWPRWRWSGPSPIPISAPR